MSAPSWGEVLRRAQVYGTDEPDEWKIARALKDLCPEEIEKCKTVEGYTPEKLLAFVMEEIRVWSRAEAPAVFRAIQLERYLRGGMDPAAAHHFIDGELAARKRGEIYAGGNAGTARG